MTSPSQHAPSAARSARRARRRTTVLGAAVVALLAPIAVATPASASQLVNEIVYTVDAANDGAQSVVLRDLNTRRQTVVLASRYLPLPGGDEVAAIFDDPELSPDGQRIAVSTNVGNANLEEGIAVVNRDGSGLRRLTEPRSTPDVALVFDYSPAWSPNGATLLFTRITIDLKSTPESLSTALFTVPASGGTPTAVPGATNGYTADWSPTGNRIVFASVLPDADQGALVTQNLDGSGRTALGVNGFMPAWSPDGSTIAYATVTARDSDRERRADATQIATVAATGGGPRTLAVTQPNAAVPTVAEYPAWMPDGESLVYDLFGYSNSEAYPPGDLWAVDKAGVRAGRIAATPGDEAQAHVQGPLPTNVVAGAASTYVPVTPQRVLDTRPGGGNVGAPAAKVGPLGVVNLQIRGVQTADGPVPSTATAVVLNVTVTGGTAATDVRVAPSGGTFSASNLNAAAGQTVPNLTTVALGANGAVSLRNTGGTVDLIADIAGYYMPARAGLGFTSVDPGRILDTRSGLGAPTAKLGAARSLDLQVTGSLPSTGGRTVSVPADARAVVLNVTATGVTSATDVRVYPTNPAGIVPTVSNLNLGANQTAPNLVTVAVGDGGKVRLRNANGSVDLIADIAGYYSAGSSGQFVPVAPTRFLDTRIGTGAAPIPTTAAGYVDLKTTGTRGVPSGATAVVLNVTATGVTAATDVRAYPAVGTAVPTVSNLNLPPGATRANLAIVKAGDDGRVRVRNAGGQLQLIADIAGYMVG